jgi:hypothetical protein
MQEQKTKMPENIEDTIFMDFLAVNPFPMAHRLLELLQENSKENKSWRENPKIKRLIWLLTSTFYNTQSNVDLNKIWKELKQESNTP